MSACLDLGVLFEFRFGFRAQSKLCFSSSSSSSGRCIRKFLCCELQQSEDLSLFPTVSMRLRPKRTCSGVVVCFGGYHINRLFLRCALG